MLMGENRVFFMFNLCQSEFVENNIQQHSIRFPRHSVWLAVVAITHHKRAAQKARPEEGGSVNPGPSQAQGALLIGVLSYLSVWRVAAWGPMVSGFAHIND